jgi:hypothetical protein
MPQLAPGDIFEIEIDGQYHYGILTHVHPEYGELVRMVRGGFSTRVTHHPIYEANETDLIFFFPLAAAIRKDIVRLIGHERLSDTLSKFPCFRVRGVGSAWWVWDGESEHKIGALTNDIRNLPIRGIWNDTILKERVRSGYSADRDV